MIFGRSIYVNLSSLAKVVADPELLESCLLHQNEDFFFNFLIEEMELEGGKGVQAWLFPLDVAMRFFFCYCSYFYR